MRIKLYLLPFLGEKFLGEITAGLIQEYRIYRRNISMDKWNRPPARNTMHQEMVTLRQVLKTALRHGWLDHLPDLSEPYRSNGKISHRAWFSPEEYKKLYEATRRRAKNPPKANRTWEVEQLHDYVLFMANTGLRPVEANRLDTVTSKWSMTRPPTSASCSSACAASAASATARAWPALCCHSSG